MSELKIYTPEEISALSDKEVIQKLGPMVSSDAHKRYFTDKGKALAIKTAYAQNSKGSPGESPADTAGQPDHKDPSIPQTASGEKHPSDVQSTGVSDRRDANSGDKGHSDKVGRKHAN